MWWERVVKWGIWAVDQDVETEHITKIFITCIFFIAELNLLWLCLAAHCTLLRLRKYRSLVLWVRVRVSDSDSKPNVFSWHLTAIRLSSITGDVPCSSAVQMFHFFILLLMFFHHNFNWENNLFIYEHGFQEGRVAH